MDVESPEHLERFRAQPEIKAVLLRPWLAPDADEARFERSPKNALFWPPIDEVSTRLLASGHVDEVREQLVVYDRPCRLVATALAPSPNSPYAISVVAADGAPVETLVELLRSVCRDYWYGSYFFK